MAQDCSKMTKIGSKTASLLSKFDQYGSKMERSPDDQDNPKWCIQINNCKQRLSTHYQISNSDFAQKTITACHVIFFEVLYNYIRILPGF